jgi:hypothetical protein
MFNMIVSNFSSLKNSDFLVQAQQIVTAMTGNPGFPEPWPATVPTLAQIQTDLAAFQSEFNATMAGDKTRIEARKNTRIKVANDLSLLGFNVQMVAQGNTTLLESSGFPVRQKVIRTQSPLPPGAPAGLTLSRGPVSGSVIVRASRVPEAGSYDLQLTAGDPTVEANWTDAGVFKNCRRIELQGLTLYKTYSVRMRALGAAGYGEWSTPTSIVVM